jgi:hypothetical protein
MGRPSLKSAANPANAAGLATKPTAAAQYPHLPYLLSASPADEWGPAVSPLHPHHLHLFPAAGQPSRIAPGRATGRPRQPGSPHAEGRCVRVWVRIGHGVGNDPIAPTPRAPEAWLERRPRVSPAQPGERPGAMGAIHPGLPAASLQKAQGRRIADSKPPTPLGFSPLHHLCLRRERRGRERHHATPGKGGREPAGNEEP